jgi:dipeptidyl aminopeptidase/acylaminoacyl peptidase
VAYDTDSWDRRVLAHGPIAAFDHAELPEPEAVAVEASDGDRLHARLYRCSEPSGRLLCWLHGGPTDQWQVTFLPRIAYWVQEGWNVIVPDHRGSTGHGRRYQQALRERWGDLDVSDTADVLRAAFAAGWGISGRTVLVGSSAGGFTVLNTLARRPDIAAGGYVLYPVTDLAALDETTHRFEAHYNATLVGARPANDARYRERSPQSVANRIAVPVMVLHGDQDPVVMLDQSRAFVAAMRAGGRESELIVYEGEGHGFRQPANQLDEFARMKAFLDACAVA